MGFSAIRATRLGLILAAIGILPFALLQSWVIFEPLNWKALEYPLSLRIGRITSPAFTTKRSASYLILLEFDWNIERRHMDCLLGLGGPYENCSDIPESLDVSWNLISDGRPNGAGASQDTRATSYNETINREIGRFDAKSGQNQVVQLNIGRDGGVLDTANPRLVILGYSRYSELASFMLSITFFVAVFVGGAGILLACAPLSVRIIQGNRRHHAQTKNGEL
jgi:hypothetical protein